ncbi:pyrroline-5-carboxylate reductase [Phycisphaerales bacterium]|nr:pyrroline-5-carboxylate reductase [Phycisphaerales bacterium]
MDTTPLLVVGGGNMGSAIIAGALSGGLLQSSDLAAIETDELKRQTLFEEHGIACFARADEGMNWLHGRESGESQGQVLLAVKPQSLPAAAEALSLHSDRSRVVITILAGTPGSRVHAALPRSRVVRAMPNLAMRVHQGATAVCLSAGAHPGDEDFALQIFGIDGQLVVRIEESMMDAFTALAGSGPGYVFFLAEAMQEAAVKMGFDPATALDVVRETVAGAAALLAESFVDPAGLRDAVTSKGGTTAAAMSVLHDAGVMQAWVRAIVAARDRGREIAAG